MSFFKTILDTNLISMIKYCHLSSGCNDQSQPQPVQIFKRMMIHKMICAIGANNYQN